MATVRRRSKTGHFKENDKKSYTEDVPFNLNEMLASKNERKQLEQMIKASLLLI